jgi:hypothetical protein
MRFREHWKKKWHAISQNEDMHKVVHQQLHRTYIYPTFVELKSWGYPTSTAALCACPVEVSHTGITMSTGQLSLQCAFLNCVTRDISKKYII